MIKKIILSFTMLISSIVFAGDTLTVYSPWPVGTTNDLTCRALFNAYGQERNLNIAMINVPGGDSMVAHRALLNSTASPALLCAGNGPVWNSITNKDIAPPLDSIKPVTGVIKLSFFVLAPENGPNNLNELMKKSKDSGKPVLVGSISGTTARVLTSILEKEKVKYDVVIYRKNGDGLVSLKDNSLDVYMDGASIVGTPGLTGYKDIGHFGSGANKSSSENLLKRFPFAENYMGTVIVFARSDMSDSDVETYSAGLRKTLTSQLMADYFKTSAPYHTVTPTTPKQTSEQLQKLLKILNAQP